MDLLQEYRNQQSWRDWGRYITRIPLRKSDRVLDLGCSVGGFASELSPHVAHVTGIDIESQFIEFCSKHAKPNQSFLVGDLGSFDFSELAPFTGVWSSFSLSYLSNAASVLKKIFHSHALNGWVALVDISCFLSGNMTKSSRYYHQVKIFEESSEDNGGYDFDFGSKMKFLLKSANYEIVFEDNDIVDRELNFDGVASTEVLESWKERLARMKGLRSAFPEECDSINEAILESLQSESHERSGSVKFVVARKP